MDSKIFSALSFDNNVISSIDSNIFSGLSFDNI
jgi:hypothetical protein